MRKSIMIFLLVSGVFLRTAYAQPSSPSDTICVSTENARKLLIAGEQKKVLAERVVLLDKDIEILTARIREKDAIILNLNAKDENNKQIIKTLEEQKTIMQEQRTLFESQVKDLEKQIKKLKRKVFWVSAAGIAATGSMVFLYLTK